MTQRSPSDLRGHRAATDRRLVLGFAALLFLVGGGLIYVFYGGGAAVLGVACMAGGLSLLGLLALVMLGLDWLSRWLNREQG